MFFADDAVSGTVEAMDRPKFVAIIEAIEKLRKFTPAAEVCIVVERQDRLARDLIVQELLLAECAKRSIPVYSADQGSLTDIASADLDPTRKMFRQMIGIMAEWEKSVIVRKLRGARDRKRAKTGRCEGQKPFGETPKEKAALNILMTMHHAGKSLGDIAKAANEMSLKTRKGGPWTRAAVYQIVTRRGVKSPEPPKSE